jgi:uncharacterized protein YndB with AHSA1/START domain
MTYDLRIERIIDAPPEVVFDAFVDPEAQKTPPWPWARKDGTRGAVTSGYA